MSSHNAETEHLAGDILDGLVRLILRDSVMGAEPSPLVWERIQDQVQQEAKTPPKPARLLSRWFSRLGWLGWLLGTGASYPVSGDPRVAWQGRLHPFDTGASLLVARMVEGSMATMRLVS
jgi:hypothetical protein